MPRVSVVIAARDATATLAQTLASVVAQDFSDWEVVVVDDGSTDATGELAAGFDPRVRVVLNEQALGPSGARNRGVDEARGELVATLDADDLWLPEYLARQVALLDAEQDAGRRIGLVACDAHLIGPAGEPLGRWSERVGHVERPTLSDLLATNLIFTSVLLPRDVFLATGGYSRDLVWGEDHDLWLRIAQAGWEIVVAPDPLACYRLRPDSLSSQSARLAQGARDVYGRALARGGLTAPQRRLARRRARLFALLVERARVAESPSLAARLALLPRTARVALEHPERWLAWLRRGPRAAGQGRHAG